MEPIAEESAKAAASQELASAEARKICIACGKKSEEGDTAILVAFATQRVLRRTDLLAVVHVSEDALLMCAPFDCNT